MENFLRKIKLLDHITIELPISKADFIKKFRTRVDASDLSLSDSFFEAFSSSKNEYKGNIDDRTFQLRRRKKFFETNRNFAIAEGKITEQSDKLILETEIKGFHKFMKIFYAVLIVFYIIFLFEFTFSLSPNDTEMPLFILPLIGVHALLMIVIPYFIMRRSVVRMKYELERDFHFWVK